MKLNKNLSIFLTATMTLLINVNLINAAVSNEPGMTENEKNSDTLIELYGDADATGILTAADSSAILQKVLNSGAYVMPIENKTSDYMKYIDVTADGMLTSADSAAVLQKVLNSAYVMPIEQHENILPKLELSKSGWAYPNVAYWSLANYPQETEQNYVVTLYKNGQIVDTVKYTESVEEIGGVIWDHRKEIAHIDFTDKIKEDIAGSYTFSVQAIGDGNTTVDSDVLKNDVPYIYSDGADKNNPSVDISSDNTIQLKLFNSAIPFEWRYSLDNDIIKLKSDATDAIYHDYYDHESSYPGSISCARYNFEPVTSGEVTIRFEYYNIYEEKADILESKTVKLKVNDDLSVSIIESGENILPKLELSKSGWAYPNVAYWSLANYPQETEQNYVVTLYKNGQIVDTVKHTESVEEIGGVIWNHTKEIAHIDFTDKIKEDIAGSYTFSVQAIGDGNTTADSDVLKNDVPYIYSDGADKNNPSVDISSDNTIQLKLFNSAIPFEWRYSLDNDIIKLKSDATDAIYHDYYDHEPSYPGGISCARYNFEPVTPGEVTINFGYYDILDEKADVLESKTVKLKVNDDLSVSIIE